VGAFPALGIATASALALGPALRLGQLGAEPCETAAQQAGTAEAGSSMSSAIVGGADVTACCAFSLAYTGHSESANFRNPIILRAQRSEEARTREPLHP
jgi:hypothetical protein